MHQASRFSLLSAVAFALWLSVTALQAHTQFSDDVRQKIDDAARQVLASTGAPAASIAVVKDGQIAYLQAYGDAKIDPRTPARPEMRFSIGSISKQFTATAILMLAEQGKLALDDPVSRFLPTLTRAAEVTIRQLLSHTSGYQDYWPQDYVPPFMLQPITADKLLDLWARKPLDFDPGTQWQYSNTGYVIAGLIVEKAAGMPLVEFLRQRVFTPLGMAGVADVRSRPPDGTRSGRLHALRHRSAAGRAQGRQRLALRSRRAPRCRRRTWRNGTSE